MNRTALDKGTETLLEALVEDLVAELPPDVETGRGLDPGFLRSALLEPARDILRRNGKRFRGRLLGHGWALAGGAPEALPPSLPLVVELLHAGSLIIDDIEDDSPTRRGEPSLHRRFGIPLALNTGNWLYFLPLAVIARLPVDDSLRLTLCAEVSDAVLLSHQGQALDLSVRISAMDQNAVLPLVRHATQLKTGSLMRLSARLGARAAQGPPGTLVALSRFGARLGLGLQMLDDWSGIQTEVRQEKGLEDLRLQRPTWPWAWLAAGTSASTYRGFLDELGACEQPPQYNQLRLRLRAELEAAATHAIHSYLQSALDDLRADLGTSGALDDLVTEVQRLEHAYD